MSNLKKAHLVRKDMATNLRGSSLDHSNFSTIALSDLPKGNLIEALYYIIDVMRTINGKYKDIQDLERQEQSLSTYMTQISNKKSEAEREKFMIPSAIGFISTIITIVAIIISLAAKRWSWWLALGPALWFISNIYFSFNPSKEGLQIYARLMREAAQLKNEFTLKSKSINEKKKNLEKDLENYLALDEIKWALNTLSKKYMDINIIYKLIEYLEEGRAYNLKEAINLFVDEQHKAIIMEKQEEAIRFEQRRYQLQLEHSRIAEEHLRIARENSAKLDDIKWQQWMDSLR